MTAKTSMIDTAQSKVSFSIKKIGFLTIHGTITNFEGEIAFDENALQGSYFKGSISPVTIDTGNGKRDEHLKSKDFFFVKEYPKISFQSTKIRKEKDHFSASGKLTILNTTEEVSIPFNYEDGWLKGNFSLNRLDFGLGKKFPSFFIGRTVQISIDTKIK